MSKAIAGAAELAGAAALEFIPGLQVFGSMALESALVTTLASSGIAMVAGSIAQAIGSNGGLGITTRTPASLRQIIRGEQRVGGTIVYQSTTGGTHNQFNLVIALATHPVNAIVNLYLDGRQVFWDTTSSYNQTVNGYNFGGNADGNNHTGPNGLQYNFGGKVFCAGFYGNQTSDPTIVSGAWVGPSVISSSTQTYPGFCSALQANDSTWAPDGIGNVPYLAGCTYVYLKIEYDPGTFPQFPEIRFTTQGKNDIFDPRSNTRGYTTNWALHVADAITDPTWGLGDNSVNQDQLIAAANVCDELIPCAAGDEAQFSLHWHYDTSMPPGDSINQMMCAAGGRLSRIGGEWYVWPAYWQGPSFSFDENSLVDAIQWTPTRSFDQLVNRVTGTYIAPNFPYNVVGNLYDSNGYWNGETANNFPYAFQPTNYPMYACDPTHGYDEDVYLIADTPNQGTYNGANAYAAGAVILYGATSSPFVANEAVPAGNAPGSLDGSGNPYWSATGTFLPKELPLPCVLSISQAQRLAKIYMLRTRQQGSGTFPMSLAAWQMQPADVLNFSMPSLNWTSRELEVVGIEFTQVAAKADDDAPGFMAKVSVQDTDPSVYEWDPTEELTPYDIPAISGSSLTYTFAPPTGLTATSDLTTALVQPDGTVFPRIELTWIEPADTFVTNGGSIEIQMCAHGSAAWQDVLLLGGQATIAFLGNVVSGNAYDLRIRSLRPSGASSVWVELDNIVCGYALSSSDLMAVAPAGTLSAYTAAGVSTIIVAAFTASYYGLTATVLGGSIISLSPGLFYYVYYQDAGFGGGVVSFYATQSLSAFVGKPGYFLVGSIVTPPASSAPLYEPSNYVDLGTATSSAPAVAYGDYSIPGGGSNPPGTISEVQALGNPLVPSSAYGQLIYEDFPAVTSTSGQNLYVVAGVYAGPGLGDPAVTSEWAITACLGGGAQPSGQLGTLNARGAWAATTAYALWDTFTESGITYLVVTGYTSGATFGPTDVANTCVLIASGNSGSLATTTYSVPVPTGTDISTITVNITANAVTTGGFLYVQIGNGGDCSVYVQ